MFFWRPIAGVLLALLLFEAVLRQLTYGHVSLDPRVGWVWRSTTVIHRLNEGWGVSHWRDDETREHAPVAASAPRVLIMGDSITEALQVDDDEVFSALLPNVNSLNIGQSGHSAADYIAFATEYRARFHPAWTVIELAPPDLADDAFNPSKTHLDAALNVRVIIMSGNAGRISGFFNPIRRRSDAIDYAFSRWHDYSSTAKMPPLFHAAADIHPIEKQSASPVASPVAAEISRLRDAYGDRLTFLFFPEFKDPPSGVEAAFMGACLDEKLSCVNIRAIFDDFRRRGDAPTGFPNSKFGEGHLNARGHAAVAFLLQSEIERLHTRGLF
jgi:hypothetical protein